MFHLALWCKIGSSVSEIALSNKSSSYHLIIELNKIACLKPSLVFTCLEWRALRIIFKILQNALRSSQVHPNLSYKQAILLSSPLK